MAQLLGSTPEAEGRYLNADLARDVYAPYRNDASMRPAMERATIAPAGYIALNLGWNHWLKNTNPAERGTVVFMAGGMASGKTTAVQKSFNSVEKKENAIFLDSVLGNFDRAEQMLSQAEAAGFSPYMAFVFRPFESAAQAAIKRLQSTGRPVRLEQLGVAHYDAQKTFLKLYQKYGQRIPFVTILNEGSPEDIRREKGVDPLLPRAYVNIEDETRTQSATGTETETQGLGRDDLGRATRQPQPRDGRVEGQARGQTPQGPLSALPEAAAKTRLTEYYAELIESAEISDWEKTAILYGFIPPAPNPLSAAPSFNRTKAAARLKGSTLKRKKDTQSRIEELKKAGGEYPHRMDGNWRSGWKITSPGRKLRAPNSGAEFLAHTSVATPEETARFQELTAGLSSPKTSREWGKYDLGAVREGSDLSTAWDLLPKSETSLPELPQGDLKDIAKQWLSEQPRMVTSAFGQQVILHQINDVKGRAEHYVAGGERIFAAAQERVRVLKRLSHTVKNAMAYASSGKKGGFAYLYRYSDGTVHVVITKNQDGKQAVQRQYVVTQYDFDTDREVSGIRILRKNGAGPQPSAAPASLQSSEMAPHAVKLPDLIRRETAIVNQNLTPERLDAWKASNPEKYAELERMRADVLKRAGFNVGPVWHETGAKFNEFKVSPRGAMFFGFSPEQAKAGAKAGAVDGWGTGTGRTVRAFVKADAIEGVTLTEREKEVFNELPNSIASMDELRELQSKYVDDSSWIRGAYDNNGNKLNQPPASDLSSIVKTGRGLIWGKSIPDFEGFSSEIARHKRLRDEGYDAALMGDESGISLVVLNPSQIKSADPLALDENGNLIGPDQWAQEDNPSILHAARSRRKASDDQLAFDFTAPAVQDYKAALEAEGITHPVAQAAAAQQDIGLPAGPSLDLFAWASNDKAQKPQPEHAKPTTYVNGDLAEYTGETREISGGTFYVVNMLEGTKAGQEAVIRRAPAGTDPNTAEKQAEWQQQQEEFRRLNSESTTPGTITDFGEKIGGARKDTSIKTGTTGKKATDERPAWARRYQIAQIIKSTAPDEESRWSISDLKNTDWRGAPRPIGDRTYSTKEEALAALPLIAVARNHDVHMEKTSAAPAGPPPDIVDRIAGDMKRLDEIKASEAGKNIYSISTTERIQKALEEGRITQEQYDRAASFGNVLSAAQMEAARAAEAEIDKIRNRPVNTATPTGDYKYTIWRKVSDSKRVQVVEQEFPTREEAMRYMAEHAVEIIETKTVWREELFETPEKAVRTGQQRREGPATAEMFQKTFGFRGVEFGNWMRQQGDGLERQDVLNHAFDGLLDLADVLGIPAKAISLNGELALAFGARGHGLQGAKAHYERDYAVINLTKMSGAGSLAHEWFHGLDHYFARQDGAAASEMKPNASGDMVYPAKGRGIALASEGFSYNSKLREEVRKAYTGLMDTIFKKAVQYVEDSQKAEKFVKATRDNLAADIKALRDDLTSSLDPTYYKRNNKPATEEQIAEFDRLTNNLLEGNDLETEYRYNKPGHTPAKSRGALAGRWSNDTLDAIGSIYKTVRGRAGFNSEQSGRVDMIRRYLKNYAQRIAMLKSAAASEEKTKRVPTDFAMNAKRIDQGSATDYWTTPQEMAARAFSAYVEDKIAAHGGKSDFLSYGSDNRLPKYRLFNLRPFPEGAERLAINSAFDNLFSTLETVETAKGLRLQEPSEKYRKSLVDDPLAETYRDLDGILSEEDLEAFREQINDDQLEFSYEYQTSKNPDSKEAGREILGTPDGLLPIHNAERPDSYRPRSRILGLAIARVRAAKTGSLIGQKVKSPDDVAVISQIYRDPRFEVLRVYYRNRTGKIVHETAVSSRMPGTTAFLPGKEAPDLGKFWEDIQATMPKVGATSFFLVHNHPSGEPVPSGKNGDLGVTIKLAALAGKAFKGHVIINSGRYADIKPDGSYSIKTLPYSGGSPDPVFTPSVPHMVLGRSANAPHEIAAIAKEIETSASTITLIGANNKGYCRAVLSMDRSMLDNPRRLAGLLARISHTTGSRFLFIAGISTDEFQTYKSLFLQAMQEGFLTDVVDGEGWSAFDTYSTSSNKVFGRHQAAKGLAFYESPSRYQSSPLAPNGQPSNLTPEDQALARSPEFKARAGDWEALAEDAAWEKTIEDYYSNPNQREPLRIGRVPSVLRAVGVSDAPMVMPPSVIHKVTVKKHTLTREMVEQIPSALRDPIFVFNSATEPNSVTILTDIRHQGKNVVAAIHLDRPAPRKTANLVVSLHERPASQIEKWIKDGLILYANQGKARAYFRSARLQLPREGSKAGNKKLRTEADVVNRSVNPESITVKTDENGEPLASEIARFRQEKGIHADTLSAARRQTYNPNQLELDFDAAMSDLWVSARVATFRKSVDRTRTKTDREAGETKCKPTSPKIRTHRPIWNTSSNRAYFGISRNSSRGKRGRSSRKRKQCSAPAR
jgi:hypothetical protein